MGIVRVCEQHNSLGVQPVMTDKEKILKVLSIKYKQTCIWHKHVHNMKLAGLCYSAVNLKVWHWNCVSVATSLEPVSTMSSFLG